MGTMAMQCKSSSLLALLGYWGYRFSGHGRRRKERVTISSQSTDVVKRLDLVSLLSSSGRSLPYYLVYLDLWELSVTGTELFARPIYHQMPCSLCNWYPYLILMVNGSQWSFCLLFPRRTLD